MGPECNMRTRLSELVSRLDFLPIGHAQRLRELSDGVYELDPKPALYGRMEYPRNTD